MNHSVQYLDLITLQVQLKSNSKICLFQRKTAVDKLDRLGSTDRGRHHQIQTSKPQTLDFGQQKARRRDKKSTKQPIEERNRSTRSGFNLRGRRSPRRSEEKESGETPKTRRNGKETRGVCLASMLIESRSAQRQLGLVWAILAQPPPVARTALILYIYMKDPAIFPICTISRITTIYFILGLCMVLSVRVE